MDDYRCRICGYTQPTDPGFCQGRSHPSSSLERMIACPSCTQPNEQSNEYCGWCQASLTDDEFDERDDDEDFDDD